MAAFRRADGPRAADVVGAGGQRVVLALAVDPADGVNRREVQHIEAHGGDARQPGLAVLERAVLAGNRAARAREHLVPGAEPGAHVFRHHAQFLAVAQRQPAVGVAKHHLRQFFVQSQQAAVFHVLRTDQFPGALGQPLGIHAGCPLAGLPASSAPTRSDSAISSACTQRPRSCRQDLKASTQASMVYS